jgi:hypothetical protein
LADRDRDIPLNYSFLDGWVELYIYRGILLIDIALLDAKARRKLAWDSKSANFTRKTTRNSRAIEDVNVAGIEKSDYEVRTSLFFLG